MRLTTTTLLCLTACYDGTVQLGQVITCADSVCPTGYQCQLVTRVCVSGSDRTPPALDTSSLTFAPRPDLPNPTRLGLGGTATVHISTDEPVVPPDLLTEPQLDCVRLETTATTATFACAPPLSSAPDAGPVTVRASLSDVFGNMSTPTVEVSLVLDTVVPAAPDVQSVDSIVFRRVPWGTADAGPSFEVSGKPGAVEPDALVVALGAAAQGFADGGGAFGPVAFDSDQVAVTLVAIDAAGNRSPPATVKDIAWVATLGGKILGQEAPNPHRLDAYPVHGRGFLRTEAFEQVLPARAAAGYTWEAPVVSLPGGGTQPLIAAYDLARGRIVGFGRAQLGNDGGILTNEVREAGGGLRRHVDVTDVESDGNPAARLDSALVYDEERQLTVLYGGQTGLPGPLAPVSNETWLYDGKSWRQALNEHWPKARQKHHMAYDARRGRTVLFGGVADDGGTFSDTWEWDGTDWFNRDAGMGLKPSGGPMTYDRAAGKVYQLDGNSQLWSWDGSAWTQVSVSNHPPPPRALGYDVARGVLVALATRDGGGGPLAQVEAYELEDGGWTETNQSTPFSNDFIYDPAVRALTLGEAGNGDPVKWFNGGWARISTTSSVIPPLRGGTAMAFSPAHDAVIAVGGSPTDGGGMETWAWDGGWELLAVSGPAPRTRAALAFDRQRLEMIGGQGFDETWHLRADAGNNWVRQQDGSELTQAQVTQLAPMRGGMLAITGHSGLPTSWALRKAGMNQTWVPLGGTSVSDDALDLKLCAAPDGGAVAMYITVNGGNRTLTRVFDGDGGSGQLMSANLLLDQPTYDRLPALVLDDSRGSVLAIGGGVPGQAGPSTDIWELRGPLWQRALLSDPEGDGAPLLGIDVAAGHHKGAQRTVVLDEQPSGGAGWLLRSADARPSLVFRVALGAVAFPRGVVFQSVRADLVAGAVSRDGAGAQAQLFLDGVWTEPNGALNGASSSAPLPLGFTEANQSRLESLLSHQPDLAVAVVPKSNTGRTDAEVKVERIEVTVRYRTP